MSEHKEVYSKILDKQDKMAEDITDIKVILAKVEESLKYHIKRTDLAEEAIALNRKQFELDMKPIKNHVLMVNAAFKIIGGISVLVGIIAGVVKIAAFFF